MSKVLVLGATGYIGFAIAQAFVRNGYKVYGLARTQEKANHLAKHEITPVIGNGKDIESWIKTAEKVDIIIEAIADYQDYTTGATVGAALVKFQNEHKQKIVIYTSGVWVYGNTTEAVSEGTPLNPLPIVASRPALEKQYLDAGAIVLRPGCVYGLHGSLLGSMFFKNLTEHKTSLLGTGSNSWAFVHVEDCADAYVKTAAKASSIRGQAFNIVSQSERISDIADAVAQIVGLKEKITYNAPSDPFSQALCLNQHFNTVRARTVLGWTPKASSILNDVATYYASWKASN